MYLLVVFVVLASAATIFTGWVVWSQRNNLKLVNKTYCSDVCPQQTRTFKAYKDIETPADCDKVGGQTIRDAALGGFIGCGPKAKGEPAVVKA